ncbi:Bug family tripartite tricarboxylate transporter substrate binding protein [Ramlibacter algicola]|uniref:Tripartite tricarboxylate transporter substrate binding protein n=1 Tax=Ramlibacter algicola TaxID=2795217 RepID=A0A934UQJ4_9BURK|nr:tripartite tricarboxylate transporter substrate binding protein [Ramlibacter algicola]MBK0392709.1 tripartite tricarboxylate transporter substrate binding protein [Ramlibacter algicola]
MKRWVNRAGLVAVLLTATAAYAQAWPTKTVKINVPYAAGGPADITAREIALKLGAEIGQPVVVENNGGAMGVPSLTAVARSDPDGHTLWMPALGNAVLQPLLSKQGGADLLSKLRPVGMVTTSPHVLVVSSKLPVKSVAELVAYAKAHPGQVSFASAGVGGTAHLGAEMFKSLSGAETIHVPYKGSSAAVNDLVSGRVSAMFSSLPSLQAVVDKGYVRLLAATAPSKSPATRSLPLMSATLPGFEYSSWYAMYVPAATPDPVVMKINAALQKVLKDPAVIEKIDPHGMETLPSTPDEVLQYVKKDTEKWGQIIRKANISLE